MKPQRKEAGICDTWLFSSVDQEDSLALKGSLTQQNLIELYFGAGRSYTGAQAIANHATSS